MKTVEDVSRFIENECRSERLINLFYKIDKGGRNRLWLQLECLNGHNYNQLWDNFKKGHGCIMCGYKTNRDKQTKYTLEYVKEILKKNNYKMVNENEYINSGTAFSYECLVCDNVSRSNFKHILDGRRCNVCSGLSKKTTEQFKCEVHEMTNGEYCSVGEYITAHHHIKMRHNVCNNTYTVTPHNFLMGRRCPTCKSSKGESRIREFLLNNKHHFQEQYKMNECRNINPLPFDFAILNENKDINCLIEYDGEQHYVPVNFGGVSDEEALENFKQIQNNDKIKNQYCQNNNIKLIRIPYWEFENIEKTLKLNLI